MGTVTIAASTTQSAQLQQKASVDMQWQSGSLRLGLKLDSEADAADILIELNAHRAVLEAALGKDLGAMDVKVTKIQALEDRRLAGCRRLQATGSFFDVSFQAQVFTTAAASLHFLGELSDQLAKAGANILVESVELSWLDFDVPKTKNKEHDDGDHVMEKVTITIGAAAVVVVSLLVGYLVAKRCKAKAASDVKNTSTKWMCDACGCVNWRDRASCRGGGKPPSALAVAHGDLESRKDEEQSQTEDIDDNASTVTPTSSNPSTSNHSNVVITATE